MIAEASKQPKIIAKYELTYGQYSQLRKVGYSHLVEAPAGVHGLSALYFDTDDFELIREFQTDGPYQELFRMRTSEVLMKESLVSMEIIKRFEGRASQRHVLIPYVNAQSYLLDYRQYVNEQSIEAQISREIEYLVGGKSLAPKVVISSDRLIMNCTKKVPLEVEFDFNIRWRTSDFDLRKGNYGEFVDPTLNVLMTIKSDGSYPGWFSELLQQLDVQPSTFSSLMVTYQEHLFNKENKILC